MVIRTTGTNTVADMKRNPSHRSNFKHASTIAPEVPPKDSVADAPRGAGPELNGAPGRVDKPDRAGHQWMIAPLVGDILQQWQLAFRQYGRQTPAIPHSGLAVCTAQGVFLAGVGLYDTTGPWMLGEHLVTNPMASARLKHRAVLALGYAALAHCTAAKKVPLVLARSRGIALTLLRLGFTVQPGGIMIGEMGLKI
jgi:hypothetical protein